MNVLIQEKRIKSILTKSGIPGVDYCVNPYTGCSHGCSYCYATFMQRFSGHMEKWGSFVDVKINSPEVLRRQLARAPRGTIMLSSVTDAYQPVESRYKITRMCLEVLREFEFPVSILTKSPLVMRDKDLFQKFSSIEVGISITTDDDRVRQMFEPKAPSVRARIRTLRKLHESGIRTYAFIGPILPMDPERLAGQIGPYADEVLIDRMNYVAKTRNIYRRYGIRAWLDNDHIFSIMQRLEMALDRKGLRLC